MTTFIRTNDKVRTKRPKMSKKQPKTLGFGLFLVHHKEFESLTFGSVGSQNHCFLGPFRIKNLHIIMLVFKQISAY